MAARRNFSDLRNEINLSSPGSIKVISAVAVLGLGAGLFFFLPDNSDNESAVASAAASAPEPASAPDESLCDKQAWPYVDQRCAKRVEAARGTRQVRIVTDKGHSVTAVTPLPIVEDKPKPTPAPVVAQRDRPLGPPAAPATAEPAPQPQTVTSAPQPAPQNAAPKQAAAPIPMAQVTVTTANRPASTQTVAHETSNPSTNERTAAVAPSAAVTAPPAPGFDAFASLPRNAKAARAAEKAAKREARREARRQKANEEGVPEDVVEAVKSLPGNGQNSRRARGVPDEVARAVEEATTDRRGRRVISVGSPNGGQRIYLVPREEASGAW